MGATAYCCNYKPKDQYAKDYSTENPVSQKVKASRLKDAETRAKRNEAKVIKIQALVRGFIQRKHDRNLRDVLHPAPKMSHRSNFRAGGSNVLQNKGKANITNNNFSRQLSEMPDYSN